jgi:hypothetical protein
MTKDAVRKIFLLCAMPAPRRESLLKLTLMTAVVLTAVVVMASPGLAVQAEKSCFFTPSGQNKWCESKAVFDGNAYYWEGWCNGKIYKGTTLKQRFYVFAMGNGSINGGGGVVAKPDGPGRYSIHSWGIRRLIGEAVQKNASRWAIYKHHQKKVMGYASGPHPIVVAVDWFNGRSCQYDH